jgi:predicted PurR-regulated permease PerM
MNTSIPKLERNLAWGVLLLLLAGCLLVVVPFLKAILWAAVLCFSSWRIYLRLLGAFNGRRTLAAAAMTLGMVLIILLPFVLVGATLADNVKEVGGAIHRWLDTTDTPTTLPTTVPAETITIPEESLPATPTVLPTTTPTTQPASGIWASVSRYWQGFTQDTSRLTQLIKQSLPTVTTGLLKFGLILGNGLIELALSIFVAFFFFRDGEAAAKVLQAIVVRIGGERGNQYLIVARNTVRGVVYGILGTALVQAIMAGIGFLIAGVPGPALLGMLTFFLSVLPVGPPLIWIPATLWLFNQNRVGWGIFMLIWGIGVSSVDNVVKPWLISQGVRMPFLLIFFGVIGGALQFGLIGVFLGPTLLAVAYGMIQEWLASVKAPTLDTPRADAA